jgi:hypothetical protein
MSDFLIIQNKPLTVVAKSGSFQNQLVFDSTGSLIVGGPLKLNSGATGSLQGTSSWAINAVNSATASSADNFFVRGQLTASNFLALTASSIILTGSNIFGSDLTNTQKLTGSVTITGSLSVNNIPVLLINQTGSITASYALTSSYVVNAQTASYVVTSNTASYVLNAQSASFAVTALTVATSSWANNATNANNSATASYVTSSNVYGPYGPNSVFTSSYSVSSSYLVMPNYGSSVGIFYVQKLYTGCISASFTGSNFNSPNTSYNRQLTAAQANNVTTPYPDPYSARNAAVLAIASGSYSSAIINVISPVVWTVGHFDPTLNGSSNGSSSLSQYADFGFDTASATMGSASLLSNNLYYDWCYGSGLRLINKTNNYPVMCVTGSDYVFNSGFLGKGNFTTVYGQAQGFKSSFLLIDNSAANVVFEADELIFQQYDPIRVTAFNLINLKIRSIKTPSSAIISAYSNRYYASASSVPQFYASVEHAEINRSGSFGIAPIYNDYWYGFNGFAASHTSGALFDVKIGNYYIFTRPSPTVSDNAIAIRNTNFTSVNVSVNISVDNLIYKVDPTNINRPSFGSQVFNVIETQPSANGSSVAVFPRNLNAVINIKNATIDGQLYSPQNTPIGWSGPNMKLRINCDNCYRPYSSAISSSNYKNSGYLIYLNTFGGYTGSEPSFWLAADSQSSGVTFTGNYTVESGSVIYSDYNFFSNKSTKHIFQGSYRTLDKNPNTPVAKFDVSPYKSVSFRDATLITNTGSVCIDMLPSQSIYIQNVISNVTASLSGSLEPGLITILSNLNEYIY